MDHGGTSDISIFACTFSQISQMIAFGLDSKIFVYIQLWSVGLLIKKSLDRSSRNDYFHSDVLEIHQNNLFFDHAATCPKHTKRNLVNN